MAIEALKKITIVCPKESQKRLLKSINALGIMEVRDAREALGEEVPLESYRVSTEEADDNLYKIESILTLMDIFAPEEESFIKGLTPLPMVTTRKEIDDVLGGYDLPKHYRLASELDEVYRRCERVIGEIENELKDLEPLADLPFDLAQFYRPQRIRVTLGFVPRKNLPRLNPARYPWSDMAWEEVPPVNETGDGRTDNRVRIVFAFLEDDAIDARRALSSVEFEEIQLPKRTEAIVDRIRELKEDLGRYREEVAEVGAKVRTLAAGEKGDGGRRPLIILKAYWSNIRDRQLASSRGVHGKWLYILNGFVRTKDLDGLTAIMEREFPESVVSIEDPAPGENVPVSISVPNLLKPIQLLTEMFGLPRYRSFDPTPYMQINFYVFFGICFSDVGYGVMLAIAGMYLNSKTKAYRGVNNLARILLFGGISSIIFGALLGSWFGDLFKPDYLGEGNILLAAQQKLVVIDPMQKTILALLVALGLGVLNQFLGIGLKMYGALRERDFLGAFSDGLCWIVTLTGLLMMAGKVFGPIPETIYRTGLWLFVAGAVGLVMTQGRHMKNLFGKLAGGVISLYGIMGSYGITAFIGDVLSYCRLLALGLTTSIVAMTFNLIAGMLRDIPYVGFILFILILVVGHVFNFLISALGAFVHSMRLLFVEFFGRFYEGGTRPFKPLQFDSDLCVVQKDKKAV